MHLACRPAYSPGGEGSPNGKIKFLVVAVFCFLKVIPLLSIAHYFWMAPEYTEGSNPLGASSCVRHFKQAQKCIRECIKYQIIRNVFLLLPVGMYQLRSAFEWLTAPLAGAEMEMLQVWGLCGSTCLCIQEKSVMTLDDAGWKGRSAQLSSAGFGLELAALWCGDNAAGSEPLTRRMLCSLC